MSETHKLHRPLQVKISIPVQTYDIDYAGIVSNIVYIRWLEDLRNKCLAENFQLDKQIEQGYSPILAGTEIEYKRPIKLFDQVTGSLWLSKLGRMKWIVQAEILANNKLAATAIQKGAIINLQTGRPITIPEEMHQKYSQYLQTN